jgi:RNA polymerase sigma-70 factor (ECF subfamily)
MSKQPDDRRYDALYAGAFARVTRELRRLIGPDAEDIAQEAFLVAHQRWDVVQTLDRPEAWVRRVALRMSGRRARRERHRQALEAATDPPRTFTAPDLDLVSALLELPDRHAAAVRLHHLEDRPMTEVAERLGCSEGAAKVLLVRARRVLAERIVGLTGHWVSEHTWSVDGIARHLKAIGWSSHAGAVIDGDLGGRGGRWELTVSNGSYLFRRDDGARFDHGATRLIGSALEMAPTLNTGRARYHARVDGRRLALRFADATIPPHLGVPEGIWAGMFFDVAPFIRADAPGHL